MASPSQSHKSLFYDLSNSILLHSPTIVYDIAIVECLGSSI